MSNEKNKKTTTKRPTLHIKAEGPKAHLSSVAAEAVLPTEADIRVIRSRIEEVFNALGGEQFPGTIIPTGKHNNAKEAAEFVLADLLSKLATARLKKATEAAENAGVFGDKESYVEGDTVMVFSDPNFSINVKMGKPGKQLSREQVEVAASEYLGKKATEFLAKCFKRRAATKQVIVSMK
jgi:hypothetical protein